MSIPAMVTEDKLLFVCERDRFFRLMAVACASQTIFWLFIASFALDMREEFEDGKVPVRPSDRQPASLVLRIGMTTVSLAIAGTFIFVGYFFPTRFVNAITILRGGTTARIGTYSVLGRRTFEVPLDKISFSAANSLAYSTTGSISIQGYRGYFMLDGRTGRVVDQPLLNALRDRKP